MDTVDQNDEMIKYISELPITRPHQIMSPAVERSVWKQNVQFMRNQMQYSLEYFQFVKNLLTCNAIYLNPAPGKFLEFSFLLMKNNFYFTCKISYQASNICLFFFPLPL